MSGEVKIQIQVLQDTSAKIGAREWVGDDGTTRKLNFAMNRTEIAALASRGSLQCGS
jgi:hypothetical protein